MKKSFLTLSVLALFLLSQASAMACGMKDAHGGDAAEGATEGTVVEEKA